MQLSGADIIVRTLIEQGCETVFGYPGGQVINIYDSLYKYQDEIHHVLTAHEQGASHAADGYARATGKVGCVIATSGPGATNLVTGIATAFLDSIPMVAITGNVPNSLIGTDSFQEVDITGVTLPITKHNYFVKSVEDLAPTIREAFRIAKSGRPGPVLVDVPKDVQVAVTEYTAVPIVSADAMHPAKTVRIEEAAQIINDCERPFIYFGGGLLASGAEAELVELADKLDAVIGCSLMGISGIPTDHPRFLGMEGMHGHYASSIAMNHSDCIIACGVRFNDRSTGKVSQFAQHAKIVHIDVDGAELCKTVHDAVSLRGDLKLTLDALIKHVTRRKRAPWQEQVASLRAYEAAEATDTREGMTPRNAILTLNKHLRPDTPVVTDVGQHQMWAAQTVALSKPRTFVSSGGLGTMGFGLGASLGAAMGSGQHTALVTGDGSFGMCCQEMATLAWNHVPVAILILNNGVLGMVRQWQTLFFDGHHSQTTLDRPTDFVALAKAFGADGETVTTVDELDAALGRAFDYAGPYVVNCIIDKDEFVMPMLPPGGAIDDIIVKEGE
jgi:acetolactate synthase I/II/III large subunit